MRRLGVQRVPARGAADSRRVEHGALQQDPRRAVTHLAGLTAHHARKRDRLLAVGDDEVVGAELALLAVESGHRLALAGAPHDDARALQLLEVEGMERMSELEQDEVGRVDHVADGPHSADAQPFL